MTPTDPTTLRTALEALVGLVDCYGLDHYGGDWGCAECHPDSDMLVAGFQCGLHLARAALATPAPAADEARCEVCGEPTAMGQGLIVIDGKRQHQTCYMGIDQPAPTPAPTTPPATEEGPAVVVARRGGDPDSCSLHGDIPRDVSPAKHVRELHAAEIDAWERVSIDGHPGWAEPTPPAPEPSARTVADCDDHHVSGMLGFCPRCGLGDATEDYPAQHPPAPGLPAALVEHWCRSCDQYLDALAARSAGSGSRVEARCAGCEEAEDHPSHRTEYRALDFHRFVPIDEPPRPTPPPAGATQVPLPATDSTPPPAVDGTRCAECGGVKDDVFHVPCLVGGPFHYVKTCHPFTPPATEPVAALVSELVGDLRLSELGRDGRLDIVARKLDAIVAAARTEVDVERLARALHDQGFGCNAYRCSLGRGSSADAHEQDARFLADAYRETADDR